MEGRDGEVGNYLKKGQYCVVPREVSRDHARLPGVITWFRAGVTKFASGKRDLGTFAYGLV